MATYKPTLHSKVRFSERVGYREGMKDTVLDAKRLGVRLDDIPKTEKNQNLRSFMQWNKIYYKGHIYIFKGQKKYHDLITVYYSDDIVLERIFKRKEKLRKQKNYSQMFTSQTFNLFDIVLYKDRIAKVTIVEKTEYKYKVLVDSELMRNVCKHLGKLMKGKQSNLDVKLYFGDFTELEERIYNRILEIPLGETITYKELAFKMGITVQKLSKIIKYCPIPIFIPTHRVVKSNGQVGSYVFSKELKKTLLNNEKENSQIKHPTKNNRIEKVEDEYFCYSIGNLIELTK